MDLKELLAAQREVAATLVSDSTPEGLVQVARRLAGLLREVRDDEFQPVDRPVDRRQLALIVSIDWYRVLGSVYEPPPSVGLVAEEIVAAGRVVAETGNPYRLRELVGWLATRLDSDADSPAPPADRSWWTRFRESVGFGVAVVRRLTLARFLRTARDEVIERGTSTLLLAALGIPLGSVLPVLADLAGKVMVSAARELEAASQAEQRFGRLQVMVGREAFDQAYFGRMRVNIDLLRAVPPEMAIELLTTIGDWVAQVGAELAMAWGLLAAHAGPNGAQWTDAATFHIGELRTWLLHLTEATQRGDDLVPSLVDDARASLDRLADALVELRRRMQASGLEKHHA